jgi:hypothetical protein
MKRLQRAAVLLSMIDEMRRSGSWCGETNIQKTAYLLQELAGVPLGFEFILYKHGPYSFDLTDELTGLRADSVLELKTIDSRYGPRYIDGTVAEAVRTRFPKTIERHRRAISALAGALGDMGVAELERISTAYLVKSRFPALRSAEDRANKLCELKPHVSRSDALAATRRIDDLARSTHCGNGGQ